MRLTELNEILGEEIIKLREANEITKDDRNRIQGIATLAKHSIGIANVVHRTDKLKYETKSTELEVSKLI